MPARARNARTEAVQGGKATPVEVAAYLRRPVKTLANWRSQGKGPKYKRVGRGILYNWADVYEWEASLPGGGADVRRGAA